MEPLCTQSFGAGRKNLLSLTLHRTILFLLASSIPIAFVWINTSTLLSFIYKSHSIVEIAHTYILFTLPDLITCSVFHPIKIYLRSQRITTPLTTSALSGTILHIAINLLFFRLGYGVSGVAVSAVLSNLISVSVLVWYVRGTLTAPTRDCLTGWAPLAKLAGPSCMSVCLEWWWYEIMIVLCGVLSDPTSTVASMGILIQTTGLIYNFPSSLGFAVSTRVGNELGANRPKTARTAAATAIGMATGMGVTAAVFAAVVRGEWGKMYTSESEILRLTAAAMPILGLCEIGNCPQTVACGVVRGTARPTTAANVNLGAFYFVGTPVAVGFAFWIGLGFCGLWIGLLAAQVSCAGLLLYVVGTTDWEMQARRAHLLTGIGGKEQDLKEPLLTVVVVS